MKQYPVENIGIKAWAEEDRPREKLMLKGKFNLTEAELIAILIGSGNRDETAVALAQRILNTSKNNLKALGRLGLEELTAFKGIGEAKAISIIASLELGRRWQLQSIEDRPKIVSSKEAYRMMAPILSDLPHEEFWIILLNRGNRVIGKKRISSGGVAGTVVDAKFIFKQALSALASSIILFHNHPSGNLKPSQADLSLTRKLKEGARCLDICLMDHLIIAGSGYTSFADEGLI